jgi:pentatricopeptide repeat protein
VEVEESLGLNAFTPSASPVQSLVQETSFQISGTLSRSINEMLKDFADPSPLKAYSDFMDGYRKNSLPSPDVMARLISALGRAHQAEKARFVYQAAQHSLAIMEKDTGVSQAQGWLLVEDHMIIALAHAGDIDGAYAHRDRIRQYNGVPSADAYGALIRCVKDTTDDNAVACGLWRESQIEGVVPNVYLYNTVISKFAKARKATEAVNLFQEMKANGFWPSSVSYGAVIGACCRVGDYQSAELLFEEMSTQTNFRPRVPPYNTMMQLYTYTKPNRERVLYYYDALLKAKVRPTAHTYKLLMDAYGTIEPVDIKAMQGMFQRLCDDNVQVQGTHWGSLINAYGCVKKDLNKAIQVFDSIASHPTTLKSNAILPDAVAYEALINVFVTLRRTDLIPVYMDRLTASGVHMTAYIANLLIKGYAVGGDLARARVAASRRT